MSRLGTKIELLSGQHIEAANTNTLENGVPYLTGPADFIGKKPVATKYTEFPKVCCDKGDILITVKGSGTGSIAISDATYCISRQLMAIRCKGINPFFAQYLLELNEKKFNSSAAGPIPGISRTDVLNLRVPKTPLPEQKAIADLLSTWDEAIEKTERLILVKETRFKRLLNDLIHQGRSNHTWTGYNLSDLCSLVSRKNGENNTNVLTSSAQNGLVSQLEYYNKSVSSKNVTGYYLLKKGEFAYNRSSAKGYPYGATKRLDRYEKGVLSTLYLCFALKSNAPCESDFLLHLFESGATNRELRAVCQEGARSHGLLNITKSDFFGIKLFLPDQDQQKKIQSALNTAQDEIDLLKQLADKYKTQKRGLMQKMLTGEWRVKPEIVNQYMEA
ncbi:Type I restriction-modification system, specificity subunit S [Olavius algarvensis spirochete endosymbiont]|uniref:restriction endonuclease subunit S n=1 Tax=Olavius algarvensis spirochete endosymbiont TaxID=260710 RepID=UPI000F1CD6D7|nr:restriction endonuclease subunit S [Olavius algarvensis spirochete endosymbiont]CAD7840601.1 MAG: Type I restriction-modification system, specificity subunit S [Olavius algarvensis spirochete endosymbiont]VDB00500.1 Type I restriction-modification system, specificity subunit S [Olavius algarvensis spirochete endosymbiont]